MERKTPDASSPSGCNSVFITGFFLIFAIAGLAMAYFVTYLPVSRLLAAKKWTPVSCTILSSEVESNSDSDGTTYRVAVAYEFEVQGVSYTGDRYDFSIGSSSGYDRKAEIVAAHPPGMETLCFVDPNDPASSVINRSPGSYLLWGLFPLPFLAVGLGGLFGIWFLGDKAESLASKGGASWNSESGVSGLASMDGLEDEIDPTGPLVLESATTPLVRGVGLGIFALLWNGFIATGAFLSYSDDGFGFAMLFFIPFLLVGIAILGAAVHQLLAATNPRPKLILTPACPSLGEACRLQWSLQGRSTTIDEFKIEIEGREAATYRRGTDTTTDHSTFYRGVLYQKRPDMRRSDMTSTVKFTLPERAMPSFEADNNKIEWRITVHGDIPRWPDIKEDFPIKVLPPKRSGDFG